MNGIERIAAERQRQILSLNWTSENDDAYNNDELVMVAIHYAAPPLRGIYELISGDDLYKDIWPGTWSDAWDKKGKSTRIRDLEKAGALIAAEIDRLLRLEKKCPLIGCECERWQGQDGDCCCDGCEMA